MSFTTELLNSKFTLNVVIEMGGEVYARFQPDSGIVIPDENLIVGAVRLQPLSVDIRDVKTSLSSNTFELLDKDALITVRIGASTNQLLNEAVVIKVGFITGSFDFADYKLFSTGLTTSLSRKQNIYSFTSRENQAIQGEIFIRGDELSATLTETEEDDIFLTDVSQFFNQGTVQINQEFIVFTARDTILNKLTGLTRGTLNSTAVEHAANEPVFQGFEIEENPLTILLQILISPGGGTVYDVLPDGLGINANLVDVAGIEQLAIDNFGATLGVAGITGGDTYRFFLANTGNALRFFEAEILAATNTRFIQREGKIALALLDQAVAGPANVTINEDTIIGTPTYKLGTDRLINRIEINWNFSPGLNRFSRTNVFEEEESQTIFDTVKTLTFNFKGIQADLNGFNIIRERADRLLARLSTSQADIRATTLFSNAEINVGDEINLVHRYLPDEGGTLGISDTLEVISRGFDLNKGTVKYSLAYTSFTGLRIGVIAPTEVVVSVTANDVFDIRAGAGVCFKVGFCIIINGEERTIINIATDTLTVNSPFTTINIGDTVKFCDIDKQSAEQSALFASIADGDTFIFDGSKAYAITF